MRLKLIAASLLCAVSVYGQGAQTPIYNGLLQSDLNAAGFKILSANMADYAGTNMTWNVATGKFDVAGGSGTVTSITATTPIIVTPSPLVSTGVISLDSTSKTNWDTAYTDRMKWDGGATGLTATTGRTSLGLVIGTNVAPATSGSSILYGNGSGGFSNVTIGTNLTFTAGTLNATGGGATDFTGLTGDFALTQTPSLAASSLMGRGSASGAGDWERITVGSGLSLTGTVLAATAGGGGTVTDFSAGDLSPLFTTTEATTTTTPALSFSLTSAGATTVFGRAAGTSGAATYSSAPQFLKIGNLTTNGFIKTGSSDGTLSVDTATYLTANQNISLTGDVTGGPSATSIATTIGANKVTLGMMATMATDSILGRATALTGNVEVLSALPFAYTGDVTRPVDSNVTTLAAGNAGNLNSGTLLAARMPALTGEVTTTVGTVATTIADGVTVANWTLTTPQIAAISNLTTNGFVKTGGAIGTLSVDTSTYLTSSSISDTAYAGTWDAVTTIAPSKNALYDYLHLSDTDDDGKVNVLDQVAGIALTNASGVLQTPITDNSTNWNTAYTDRLQWDGGSTNLVAATGRTSLALNNVTNDAQTKASIVPNTAPAAGQILAGNAGATAYAPVTVSGSGATISLASTGVMTIGSIANASLDADLAAIGNITGAQGDVLYYGASGWAKLAAGTNGNQLTTHSTGANPTWDAPGAGGGGSPGGSDTQVQFNDATAFGGSADLTFNKTTKILTLGGQILTPNAVAWTAPPISFTGDTTTGIGFGGAGLINMTGVGVVDFQLSTTKLALTSATIISWCNGPADGTPDTGFSRNAAGVLEVNNGTAGQYRDLMVRNLTISGTCTGCGGGGSVDDTAFASSWDTVTTIAPSKNVVYDILHTADTDDDGLVNKLDMGDGLVKVTSNVVSVAVSGTDYLGTANISDTAFAGTWNTVTTIAPSKNAVYDYMLISDTDADGKTNVLDLTAGIVETDGSGVVSTAVAGTDYVSPTGTETLTNKRINPRVVSVASSATWSPNADTTDVFTITTAQATNVTTISAPSGTPVDGQQLMFRIKCDATPRTLPTWNAIYRFSTDMTAPTTLVASKTFYLGFVYNSTDTKWDNVAQLNNF